MIEGLSKIGLTGLIGFLLGLVLVSCLQPETPGGVGFTIVLAIVICYVIESLSRLLINKIRKRYVFGDPETTKSSTLLVRVI